MSELFAAIVIAASLTAARAAASGPADLATAKAQATTSGKPILIDFSSPT